MRDGLQWARRHAVRLAAMGLALAVAGPVGARVSPEVPPAGAPVLATVAGPTLTLERVFASPALEGAAPVGIRLSPDGHWLGVLRNRPEDRDRYDLWGYDLRSHQWSLLVDSARLSAGGELSEAEKMQRERQRVGERKGIVTYAWAPDSKSVLVPLDGHLLLVGLDGSVRPVPGASGGELDPRLSPRGDHVAYLRDQRLWVAGLSAADNTVRAITPPETASTVHWGEAEFIAAEELSRYAGYWWSPDGTRLAVERFDEAPVKVVTRAAIGADGTRTYDQRYPIAGTANAEVSLWVIDARGTTRVPVEVGLTPDTYLARVDWSGDGRTLYVQRLDRAQTRLDLFAVDPSTGKASQVFSEVAAPRHWINLTDCYRFLGDGSVIWRSQRDGFGHLWRFARGQWQQLTHGAWEVSALLGVDERAGRLFFAANRDDVLTTQIYALDLAHPDRIERLTDPAFTHSGAMDGSARALVITRHADAQPPQTYLADTHGQRLAWVDENRVEGTHAYAPYLSQHRPAQYGSIAADDGTLLHYRMITPPLEPGRRYPVFTYHYGGPHVQVVERGWTGALEQAVVARGYIWFELDNRGSDGRGVAFEQPIYRAMGAVEVADQVAGARWLKTQPFVDPARVSTFGWSYGGYLTLKLLEHAPGVFAAGIAVAPVTRWDLYDTAYTERYLGTPQHDAAVYARTDVLGHETAIRDPLLLVHGMADDNVVLDHSTALIARLQAEAIPFELMLYPGQTHGIGGPKVSKHLYETMFRFLDRNGAGSGH